jgi:hypothetical protein
MLPFHYIAINRAGNMEHSGVFARDFLRGLLADTHPPGAASCLQIQANRINCLYRISRFNAGGASDVVTTQTGASHDH